MKRNLTAATIAALALAAPSALAGPLVFDFKDPKDTTAVSVTIDALLEPVVGYADGISGTATFDPMHPEKTTGTIKVAVSSLRFSNEGYSRSARGYGLNETKFPYLTCTLKKIVSGKKLAPNLYSGTVAVDFTAKGVTKALTIPLKVQYHPGRGRERDGVDGDLLTVRSSFFIKRSDFGIAKDVAEDLASDAVEIRVAIVGTHRKAAAPKHVEAPKPAETPKPETLSGLDVAARMAVHNVAGCSIALVKNYQVAWVKHYGTTGNDAKTPVGERVLFAVGQMSEPVAGIVALKLAQAGTVDLDTDINQYLKRWKTPKSEKPVTLRLLLENKSGFSLHKYMGHDPTKPLPSLPEILADAALATAPGTVFRRAAENISVLQLTLEDATGKPWNELLAQTLRPVDSLPLAFPPSESYTRFAKGHDDDGKPLPHGGNAYPELAASGLWASTEEYADLLGTLMSDAAGKSENLLKPEWAKLAFAPAVPLRNDGADVQGEGLLFGFAERDKKTFFFRGGNSAGYYAQAWLAPERGSAIVVFTNRNLCWKFTNEVRDALWSALYD